MPSLPLSSVIRIKDPLQYKLHVARWNGHEEPLDVYSRWKWLRSCPCRIPVMGDAEIHDS